MPKYSVANSDATRLAFMDQAIQTAVSARANNTPYLDDPLFNDLTAHYAAYDAAHKAARAALGQRVNETAESAAAMDKLKMYISHMWTAVYNRAQRQDLSVSLLTYYNLDKDGTRPVPSGRREWLRMAADLIDGDAKAVVAGFAPIAEPSAVELQAMLDSARAEAGDIPMADKAYNDAQTAVGDLRPRADELIKEVRDVIIFATRRVDNPGQRRILRSYGSRYRYLPGEPIDDGDTTIIVEEENI